MEHLWYGMESHLHALDEGLFLDFFFNMTCRYLRAAHSAGTAVINVFNNSTGLGNRVFNSRPVYLLLFKITRFLLADYARRFVDFVNPQVDTATLYNVQVIDGDKSDGLNFLPLQNYDLPIGNFPHYAYHLLIS